MTRSIRGSGRVALLLAGTAAAGLLLSGCGAGQIAETAKKVPSVQGVNVGISDNLYQVNDLYVQYPGVDGYAKGANAPLVAVIYNNSPEPVTVTVTTDSAREVLLVGGTAASVQPSPSESATEPASATPTPAGSGGLEPPSPTASASESAPAGGPARIDIPGHGFAQLNGSGRFLQLVGLNDRLLSGQQVNLVFDFGNGQTIRTPAPIGVPLSPAPQASPIIPREGAEAGNG